MEMDTGKLFIGGISWDTNEDRLREYFETFGEVVEAVIMKDRTTGRARGFGFVVFAEPAVAERVVMEKHMIDGRTVSTSITLLFSAHISELLDYGRFWLKNAWMSIEAWVRWQCIFKKKAEVDLVSIICGTIHCLNSRHIKSSTHNTPINIYRP